MAAAAPDAITIFRQEDPDDLASNLRILAADRKKTVLAKEASLSAAKEIYSWEQSASTLIEAVERALTTT